MLRVCPSPHISALNPARVPAATHLEHERTSLRSVSLSLDTALSVKHRACFCVSRRVRACCAYIPSMSQDSDADTSCGGECGWGGPVGRWSGASAALDSDDGNESMKSSVDDVGWSMPTVKKVCVVTTSSVCTGAPSDSESDASSSGKIVGFRVKSCGEVNLSSFENPKRHENVMGRL